MGHKAEPVLANVLVDVVVRLVGDAPDAAPDARIGHRVLQLCQADGATHTTHGLHHLGLVGLWGGERLRGRTGRKEEKRDSKDKNGLRRERGAGTGKERLHNTRAQITAHKVNQSPE